MISSRLAPRLSAPRACSATSLGQSDATAAAITINSRVFKSRCGRSQDGPEAIFMDGLGVCRADRVELVPRLQPVFAESLVANRLAARGAILVHRFLPCVEAVARRP